MKIEGGRSVSPSATTRRAGAAAAPGFAPTMDGPQRTSVASPASAVTPLDAIMALQAEGEFGDRRARQARRGRAVLDALDELVRGIALGSASTRLLNQLRSLRNNGEATGEPGLDSLLREIDTRLEVELAKLEMAAGSA